MELWSWCVVDLCRCVAAGLYICVFVELLSCGFVYVCMWVVV